MHAKISKISPGLSAITGTRFITIPISNRYVPLGKKRLGAKLTRKFSYLCYTLSDIISAPPDPFLIGYMGTLIFLGDEISDEKRGRLMDGVLDQVPRNHPIHKVYNKFVHRASSHQLKNIMSTLAQLAEIQDTTASRQFKFTELSCRELEEITKMKGGYTLLAVLYMLKENPGDAEKRMFFELGFLVQLLDDYHDCIKDKEKGIATLYTKNCCDITKINTVMANTKTKWLKAFPDKNDAVHRLFFYLRIYRFIGEVTQRYPLFYAVVP